MTVVSQGMGEQMNVVNFLWGISSSSSNNIDQGKIVNIPPSSLRTFTTYTFSPFTGLRRPGKTRIQSRLPPPLGGPETQGLAHSVGRKDRPL